MCPEFSFYLANAGVHYEENWPRPNDWTKQYTATKKDEMENYLGIRRNKANIGAHLANGEKASLRIY